FKDSLTRSSRPKQTRSTARTTSPRLSRVLMSATDTATATSIPARARLMWLYPNYAPALFLDWLLERRARAKRALTTVIATCYLKGVSTRRMNDLVASLKINNLSKSQVSETAKDLDELVEDFR